MSSAQHSFRIAFVIGLLLISLPAPGQSKIPPSPDEASEVSATGAISGRVINENGQAFPMRRSLSALTDQRDQAGAITTKLDGTFEASGLDRLVYLVSASAPAYTTPPRDPDSTQCELLPSWRFGDTGVGERRGYYRQRNNGRSGTPLGVRSTRANDPRR